MYPEKSLWFHAYLAFGVIPGTRCCTLMKCLWCVDHTCSTVTEGSYCKFWLPWSLWHYLPLWRRRVTNFYSMVGGVDVFDKLLKKKTHSCTSCEHMRIQRSQYSMRHFVWEKRRTMMFRPSVPLCETISANAAQKSWLSAPQGKCWTHLHYYSPTPYWAADWEE